MRPFDVALVVIAPTLLLLAYGLIKTGRRSSRGVVLAGFIGGVGATAVAVALETPFSLVLQPHGLPPVPGAAARALLAAAIPEELVKLAALVLVVYRFADLDNASDMIMASLAVALGFAVTEDAVYAGGRGGGGVALARSVSAVPMHAVFGLAVGSLVANVVRSSSLGSPLRTWRSVRHDCASTAA